MSRFGRALLPLALFSIGAVPTALLIGAANLDTKLDGLSFAHSLLFAAVAGGVALVIGGATAVVIGTLEFPGRRAAAVLLAIPIAAPPAFWWLGFSRLPGIPAGLSEGLLAGAVAAGLALSPVVFLLGLAAIREIPTSAYEAARLCLSPGRRFGRILIPLTRSSALAAFALIAVLTLAESEIPFLFGFRTAMTEIVTTFSRSFDPAAVALPAGVLVLSVLVLASLAAGPILRTLLAQPRGGVGVRRRKSPWATLLVPAVLTAFVFPLAGYAWPALRAAAGGNAPRVPFGSGVFITSIAEPAVTACVALGLGLAAAYPLRQSRGLWWLLVAGLLLFCLPPAINAIGWIGVDQRVVGRWTTPISVVHLFRLWGLAALGFAAAYVRLPSSLESAARLVPVSPVKRATAFVLPALAPSLAASSLLSGALVFADRDVASVLLPPGSERLMLDLYLLSANAPSSAVGLGGLFALGAAAVVAALAAGAPWLALRHRG